MLAAAQACEFEDQALIKKYKVYSLPLVSARFHGNICGLLVDIAVADHGKERISFFVPATQGKDQQQPEFFKSSCDISLH